MLREENMTIEISTEKGKKVEEGNKKRQNSELKRRRRKYSEMHK